MKKKLITILATLLLLIGNVFPAFAAEAVTIEFSTDKDIYTAQNTNLEILVTGKVLKGTAAGKGTSPTLMLKNPSGNLVEIYQWPDSAIAADGSISKKIVLLRKNLVDGNYTIYLSAYTAEQKTKTIQITGSTTPTTPPPTSTKELTINTVNNKVDYKTGETVDILGRVTEGGQAIGTIDVALSIEKSGTKLLDIGTVTSAANGDYTSTYVIPTNFTAGAYSIKATLADGKTAKKDINITVATPPTTNPDPQPTPDPQPQPGPVIPVPVQDPKAPEFDMVTSESTVITGQAEKGTKVTITDQKLLVLTAITGEDGKFSVTLPSKLKAGTTLYAIASIDSGQVSKETTIVVTDKTAPEAPKVNEIKDYNRLVKGQSEADAKIIIKAGDEVLVEGKAGVDGLFALPITTQKAGTKLSITAIDTEGNVSIVAEITVIDKTPPAKAKVFKVSETKVIGKAEANATVTVSVGELELASGQADENGNYSITMKAQKANTKVNVTVTDEAGNVSIASKVMVKDTTPPAIPNVTSVSQTKVTGKAEPNAYVFVKIAKTVIAIGKADSKGNYSITFKKQKVGTTLSVNAKDSSLNIGDRFKFAVK